METKDKVSIECIGGQYVSEAEKAKSKVDPPWPHFAWLCTLSFQGRTMNTPYKCGVGHIEHKLGGFYSTRKTGFVRPPAGFPMPRGVKPTIYNSEQLWIKPTQPKAADVLSSLLLDACSYDNACNLEDFCTEFGYSEDSRKAEGIYRACGETAKALRHFLGAELYARALAGDSEEIAAELAGQGSAAQ